MTDGSTENLSITSLAGALTAVTAAVPEPDGQPVAGGLAVITELGADVAEFEPEPFVAVTRTRSVWPTSAPLRVYTWPVAPPMSEHPPPFLLQRPHRYANEVGFPVHVPLWAVRSSPSTGVPLIVGGEVFCGAAVLAAVPLPARRPRATATSPVRTVPRMAPATAQRLWSANMETCLLGSLRFRRSVLPTK